MTFIFIQEYYPKDAQGVTVFTKNVTRKFCKQKNQQQHEEKRKGNPGPSKPVSCIFAKMSDNFNCVIHLCTLQNLKTNHFLLNFNF